MPILTRWFLKSSLICFLMALIVGVLLNVRSLLDLPGEINTLSPIYFHLFMFGWVTQLIFGVVYWMFPKYSKEQPRFSERLGWLTFGALNIGLALRVITEPAVALDASPIWKWLLAISALLQWLSGVFFVINTWGRVKGR